MTNVEMLIMKLMSIYIILSLLMSRKFYAQLLFLHVPLFIEVILYISFIFSLISLFYLSENFSI